MGFVAVAMGVYGIAEIIVNFRHEPTSATTAGRVGRFWLSKEDARAAWRPVLRGTAMGSLLGVLPGGGALLAAFASCSVEKKLARDPSRFGAGVIEGVAAPEAANNAAAQTSFIPLLTLGLPANAVMALMIGPLMMHGVAPGPQRVTERPALFWGVIASMWIGNAMLVLMNLPLIGLWIRLLSAPLPAAVSDHRAVVLHRRLRPQQQQQLRHPGGRRIRRAGLPVSPVPLRARTLYALA